MRRHPSTVTIVVVVLASCAPGPATDQPDAAGLDAKAPSCNPSTAQPFSKQFGATPYELDEPFGLATGPSNEIVMTGGYSGSIDFGGDSFGAGLTGIYFAKLDAAGQHVFSKAWSTYGDSIHEGRAVAVDATGNIALVGTTFGGIDLGDGVLLPNGSFVAKFDPDGHLLWSHGFFGYAIQDSRTVAFDPDGNIIFAGIYDGAVDFGGGPLPNDGMTSAAGVAKFDPNGHHLWSKLFPATGLGLSLVSNLAIDHTGNIALVGWFQKTTIDFGLGVLAADGMDDAFVVELDPHGQPMFSQRFGSTGDDEANAVAFDSQGNIVVAGTFTGSIDFGGGELAANGQEMFLVKLDHTGHHVWSRHFVGSAFAGGIAIDALDRIVATGTFQVSIDFGGGVMTTGGGPYVPYVYVAKFDSTGTHLHSARFGDGSKNTFGYRAAVDSACNVVVTGIFTGSINFGVGQLVAPAGNGAVYVARGHDATM